MPPLPKVFVSILPYPLRAASFPASKLKQNLAPLLNTLFYEGKSGLFSVTLTDRNVSIIVEDRALQYLEECDGLVVDSWVYRAISISVDCDDGYSMLWLEV